MRFVVGCFFACAIGCGDNSRVIDSPPLEPVRDPLNWVDPTIGTGGLGYAYGSAFVGAAAPHGLVKLGPDTSGEFGTIGFQHYSGYYAGDDVIERFSHMHLHGAGLSDYGVLGVMPTTNFEREKTSAHNYRASFSKSTELARPGRYEVVLEPSQIRVELVATTRAAHHRYTFPADQPATVVVDLLSSLAGGEIFEPMIEIDAERQTIAGAFHSSGQMSNNYGGHAVYFAARTREPWTQSQSWEGGVALEFAPGSVLELQVGLSLVSVDGAIANLESELPEWDLEKTAAATAEAWRQLLARVLVEGGTTESRRIFYSALYHSFLMPTITSDVDGAYRFGDQVGQMAVGDFVSDLSLWDTYRTLHPLYHLIAPDIGASAVRSLIAMSRTGGGFPRWPIATGESGTMLGASADVVLADAMIKLPEIEGVDAAGVFDELVDIATNPARSAGERGGRNPADDYIALGYVPASVDRSVSTHLEFAVDDFALGQLAVHLGHDAGELFAERAQSYRHLFDARTKTFRPLDASGDFASADGYDPQAFGSEFAEANAMQMLWAPLHDVSGLCQLLGGDDILVATLETFFTDAEAELAANPLDSILANAAPRPHYWHGNEPDIHAAYLFGQLGRDDLTQRWLTWIRTHLYGERPDGLAGNDDSGTLSSWYVWSALGFYPVAGSDRYFVGMPLFSKVTVTTATGSLVVNAPDVETSGGIASVSVNGVDLERAELRHYDLSGSAVIDFVSAPAPTSWSQSLGP